MGDEFLIGVDIGGTKIDFVLVNHAGEIIAEHRLPTNPQEGADAVLGRVAEGVAMLHGNAPGTVKGVGIGCPGHVDPKTGLVRRAVNLGWEQVALRDETAARVNLPVAIENDVNAAALGELYFGAARGCDDFAYLAVGTGLGGAAVVNGRLVTGGNAFAMEVGHLALGGERVCGCGQRGCNEMYVSGVGVMAAVEEYASAYPDSPIHQNRTTAGVIAAARADDTLGVRIFEEAGRRLGLVMACCACMMNSSLFVIGGGLGLAALDLLLPWAKEEFARRVLPEVHAHVRIEPASMPRLAVGAACLVMQKD